MRYDKLEKICNCPQNIKDPSIPLSVNRKMNGFRFWTAISHWVVQVFSYSGQMQFVIFSFERLNLTALLNNSCSKAEIPREPKEVYHDKF